MSRDPQLAQKLTEALAGYSAQLNWLHDAYNLSAEKVPKRVKITWPYPLTEVYFDFLQNDANIFSESIEFYDGESSDELCEYVAHVVKRFLDHPSRIESLGTFLKRTELQILEGDKWISVFD